MSGQRMESFWRKALIELLKADSAGSAQTEAVIQAAGITGAGQGLMDPGRPFQQRDCSSRVYSFMKPIKFLWILPCLATGAVSAVGTVSKQESMGSMLGWQPQ